jgi:hypothetical protein
VVFYAAAAMKIRETGNAQLSSGTPELIMG